MAGFHSTADTMEDESPTPGIEKGLTPLKDGHASAKQYFKMSIF